MLSSESVCYPLCYRLVFLWACELSSKSLLVHMLSFAFMLTCILCYPLFHVVLFYIILCFMLSADLCYWLFYVILYFTLSSVLLYPLFLCYPLTLDPLGMYDCLCCPVTLHDVSVAITVSCAFSSYTVIFWDDHTPNFVKFLKTTVTSPTPSLLHYTEGAPKFELFDNFNKGESAMFRFGSKTAKSKISRKLVKKPIAQTTAKFRPRPNKSWFFLLNMDMVSINNPLSMLIPKKSTYLCDKMHLKNVAGQNVLRNFESKFLALGVQYLSLR
jgi:hypothetical protein